MRTAQITIVCLTLSLALAVAPALGAAEPSSDTRTASCIVKIAADPDILPLNPDMLERLIRNSRVAGRAAWDVFGLDAEQAINIFQGIRIEWLSQQAMRSDATFDSFTPGDGHDTEMRRQMEDVYGSAYGDMMGVKEPDAEGSTDAEPRSRFSRMGGMGTAGGGTRGHGGTGRTGTGGTYGAPTAPVPTPGRQQTAIVRLSIQLPDEVEPKATEFIGVLVKHLRQALQNAYERHEQVLNEEIEFATYRRNEIEQQLRRNAAGSSSESMRIREQLSTVVDVSALTPDTPFQEAIEILQHAVEPPLPIVVLWKDLSENCDIVDGTAIDMDGLPRVKLETALRMLLKAVGGAVSDISYQVDDDVIVIGVTQKPAVVASDTQVDIRDLTDRRRDLSRQIQNLEMEMASAEARCRAIEEQIARTRAETSRKLDRDTVTQELQKLVQMNADHLSLLRKQFDAGSLAAAELARAQENLARAKIELARRQEELSKAAGGDRLESFNSQLSQMAIQTAEAKARIDLLRKQLGETERQLTQAATFDPQAARLRTTRQALDIAERQIAELTNRLVRLQRPAVTVIASDAL